MNRNKTASQKNFAISPRADIPRSKFKMRQTRKQAFNASELIPIMCEEVLPGDTWQHTESIMARLATPIAPAVDDIDLETFYFYVPNRILWTGNTQRNRWEDFITGVDPALTVPKIVPYLSAGTPTGYQIMINGVFDHFGLLPQNYDNNAMQVTAFPIFAYFMIYNEWFRDQNLQDEWTWSTTWTTATSQTISNGASWEQQCLRANKRHDYFTSSLPFAQKGAPVQMPLGATAPIFTTGVPTDIFNIGTSTAGTQIHIGGTPAAFQSPTNTDPINVFADLGSATSATINAIRLAFQTQRMLERDARGGSRYVEQLISHFGVRAPDFRLQRPEYLGGSKIPITVNPVAQTADYTAAPDDTASAVGNLGAEMHASGHKRTFTYAAVEHGYIIGLALVRATPTYQQGTRRHWRRETRLDYYLPVFSHLGEQAVATQEIYQPGDNTPSNETWGYQERWAEMRYTPNEITGHLRSTSATPMDWWHYAEEFGTEPALNDVFITDKTQETLARSLATAPTEQWSAQIIMDIQHSSIVARLMPTYSVPGLIDHF